MSSGMQVEWTRLGSPPSAEDAADQWLNLVAEIAGRAMTSATAVSVTCVRDGRASTSGAYGATAPGIDEAQYASGRGPCLVAATGGGVMDVVVADEADRWPEFASAAGAAGVARCLSLPLTVNDRTLGSLNVYTGSLLGFSAGDEELIGLLALQAGAVLAAATAVADGQRMVVQLREALETRDIIGQAKGMLMERESCTPEAAFDILRRASQRTNRKLRDVAADLVASRSSRVRRSV